MMRTRWLGFAVLVACAVATIVGSAHAAYPEKPVRIVVPFTPGGVTDVLARLVASKLAERLKQPFVVENKGGAGGILGTDAVAKAAPDGYTLLFTNTIQTTNPAIYRKLPYDAERDFVPVALASDPSGLILVASASLPAKSVAELIALAKQKPNEVSYATPGVGSAMHMAGEMFNSLAGVKLLHVPYKGMAQALNDVISGQVMLTFQAPGVVLPHIQSGKLRALGQTGSVRSGVLPDVPTLAESGLDGYYIAGWFGLFAPAATPPEIVKRLAAEAVQAMSEPATREKLNALGASPPTMTQEQFAEFVKTEAARAAGVAKMAGIDLDAPQ